ncbi:MAG: zinc-dependent metalloprotease, partial [Actinomycetota bacterium]|nr:zinc-dependent metalloprotease [Actinomycetota bacterium]
MAGDLPFEEVLVIHQADGEPSAEAAGAVAVGPPQPPRRVLQRFGDRVEIRLGAEEGTGTSVPDIPDEVLQSLSETERFGVEALQLRASPEFAAAKAERPYDGARWDMPGCAEAPGADSALLERTEALGPEALEALAAAPGTSDYLMGSVALGVVIVNGPTTATQFSAAEQTKIVAEVQAGAGWHAGFNRWAGVSFNYDIRVVNITTQPNATATDNESRFRDPAVAQLGFQANWNGVFDYINWMRTNRRTNWAYCVFFVKGYPLDHFAYASIGGPRIVMDYNNDGWGPDNIDRVFAHESGHIFGAPDEYASSGCDCNGSWGRFGEPNSNCENCAGGAGVGCLMRANEWSMCGATKRHLGWGLTSMRTRQPSVCNVVSRSTDKLDVFVCDGGGNTLTAAWEPAMVSWWEGWWNLRGGRAAPGAPVTAVSRRPDYLDVFVIGLDGRAYTAAWAPDRGWQGWWPIGNVVFPQGTMINAVVRSQDHLDIFGTDTSGRVLTAAWEPAFTDGWHGWWQIRGGLARPGAPVTAVSRRSDYLDVFAIGNDGRPYTAAWTPTSDGWQGWWRIRDAVFPQGSYIGAVSRSADKLDVFGTDTGGRV